MVYLLHEILYATGSIITQMDEKDKVEVRPFFDNGDVMEIAVEKTEENGFFYERFKDIDLYKKDTFGRRTKCCDELTELIATGISGGLSEKDAAEAVGLSVNTLNRWKRRGREEIERLIDAENNGEIAEIDPSEEVFVNFCEAMKRSVPQRKYKLLQRIDDAGKGTWQANAWLLERIHPDEFGKRTRVDIKDWRSEVIELIKDGVFGLENYEDLKVQIGDKEARRLFERAGHRLPAPRESYDTDRESPEIIEIE